jgi:hypothetical protein
MRRVFRAGAVVVLLAILAAPAVFAEDALPGTEAPGMRIGPPGGMAVQDDPPGIIELFWLWLEMRIGPPIG